MKTMDPGHYYFLNDYSGDNPNETVSSEQSLHFMHRIGSGYPGNQDSPYDGTNCQEVIRALIARCKYLNSQIPCNETRSIIHNLRISLWLFESRAAKIHGYKFDYPIFTAIEDIPTCRTCGHIVCKHKELKEPK